MIKLGVIGLGVGKLHMQGIVRGGKAEIAAICDTNEELLKKVAEEFRVANYSTDYREMLKDETIDGILVTTPDHVHLEQVCAALRAGKHVLCEKPLALHMDECREMMKVAEETGKIFMVGQVCRVTPGFVMAKKIIDEGLLGDLYFVESEYAHDYSRMAEDNWRRDPAIQRHGVTGGGCHAVDLIRWLTGEDPIEVCSYSTHKALVDWPCDDSTIAIMKFNDGLKGKVYVSTGCQREYTMRTVIYGTKGTVVVDNKSNTMTLYVKEFGGMDKLMGKNMNRIAHQIPVSIESHNFTAEIAEFCHCVENNLPASIPAIEGAKTVAVCEAIIRSSATGQIEKVQY